MTWLSSYSTQLSWRTPPTAARLAATLGRKGAGRIGGETTGAGGGLSSTGMASELDGVISGIETVNNRLDNGAGFPVVPTILIVASLTPSIHSAVAPPSINGDVFFAEISTR